MKQCVLVLVLLSSFSLVLAGPFDAALVPNDAHWVMHVDFAALRGSVIGQSLLEKDMNAGVQQQWRQAEEMLGMDVREDLHAVTMYGSGIEQDDVVVWLRGNLDADALVTQAATMDGYQRLEHGRHVVHSWVDTSEGEASRVYGAIVGNNLGVLGPNQARIEKALQVLDGSIPSVADGGISVAPLTGRGVLVAATADFSNVDLSQNPMLAQANVSARNFRMDMRETDGTLGIRIAVQQGSVQEAQQALEMLNGFKMMGLMQLQQQNPEMAGFLQAITIHRNEDTLLLSLSHSSEKLVQMIKSAIPSSGQ